MKKAPFSNIRLGQVGGRGVPRLAREALVGGRGVPRLAREALKFSHVLQPKPPARVAGRPKT